MIIDKILESKIKTYAFVGPSGTGKSYRAQMVASERNIRFIIDDGLLIKDNEVIAGKSAKKAETKIQTVKKALFNNPEEAEEIKKAFRKHRPESILILGTSDNMVDKIRQNLGLPPIVDTIYITDVATEEEMAEARRIRLTEGKHVIPVPTFEIKKEFSGYMLDPLQIFKSKGRKEKPYISEKSIIRPTFSYMGNFKISDTVFKQIIEHIASKIKGIHKISKIRIDKFGEGISIYMEVTMVYGFNIKGVSDFKKKAVKEIENLTAMNVEEISVVAKAIYMPNDYNLSQEKGEKMGFVVGIDGPAGSGKGTVTKEIANRLNLINIDTGSTYRCVSLKVLKKGISIDDKDAIIDIAKNIDIEIKNQSNGDLIFLDGENVTDEIRSKEVTGIVSPVSSIVEVRKEMVNLQRKLAEGKNVIMEGRDICTYVFPNADVKIYLDASEDVRAKRRYDEMKEKGIETTYEEVLDNIQKRDYNDKNKEMGALKLAEDSIVVDTTNLTIEEVVERIIEIIKDKKTKENI